MWLLSTQRLELKFFNRTDEIEGGYAILSHVWGKSEQTFQDIQRLQAEDATYEDARVSAKIRGCVKAARAHGIGWLWIDASCIDKTSSAELSETVNSMFGWYAEARVCYAYLQDVPEPYGLDVPGSAFCGSKWFKRGWTLQELIAPRFLVFLSAEWTFLGTKASLAPLLSEITGVDLEVLTFRRELRQVSVARRMSWAAKRQTTRVEDEAYSLLGIFGITMPTIYGEGRNAFQRLQEEIMKHSPDQTLFAWGEALPSDTGRGQLARDIGNPIGTLLASSPHSFSNSADYRSVSLESVVNTVGSFIHVPTGVALVSPDFTITSSGIRCELVVIDIEPFILALLGCRTASGECVGLILHQRHDLRSNHPHYLVGASDRNSDTSLKLPAAHGRAEERKPKGYRLFHFTPPSLATLLGRDTTAIVSDIFAAGTPRKLYISRDLSPLSAHPWLRLLDSEPQDIYLPAWFPEHAGRAGFALEGGLSRSGETVHLPRDLLFINGTTREAFIVHLERSRMWICVSVSILPFSQLAHSTYHLPHSATRRLEESAWRPRAFEEGSLGDGSHPISLQHYVRYWPNGVKAFGDDDRTVRVSCVRWTAGGQCCLDVALEGRIYVSSDSNSGAPPSRNLAALAPATLFKRLSDRERRVYAETALEAEVGDPGMGGILLPAVSTRLMHRPVYSHD